MAQRWRTDAAGRWCYPVIAAAYGCRHGATSPGARGGRRRRAASGRVRGVGRPRRVAVRSTASADIDRCASRPARHRGRRPTRSSAARLTGPPTPRLRRLDAPGARRSAGCLPGATRCGRAKAGRRWPSYRLTRWGRRRRRAGRRRGSGPRPTPTRSTLTVVGDLMLTRGVPDPAAALAPMTPLLRRADLTVGNLESTLSDAGSTDPGRRLVRRPARRCSAPLRRAGFDALSLANNHAGDYGDGRAARHGRPLSGAARSQPFGAGSDLAAAAAAGGRSSAAACGSASSASTPSARRRRRGRRRPGALSVRMPPRTGPLVQADLDHVLGVVRRTARQADVVVVLPHWGTQYTHRRSRSSARSARALVRRRRRPRRGWSPALGAGPRRRRRGAGAALAGQLRLRHGLHGADDAGRDPRGDVLGRRGSKAVRLVPYRMDAATSRRAGCAGASRRRRSWPTCRGRARSRSRSTAERGRLTGASQATTVRAVRRSWARSTTAGTSPGEW